MEHFSSTNLTDKATFNVSDTTDFFFRKNTEPSVAIFCCGIILNTLFLYSIYYKKSLCKPTLYLLINLAVCGILLGLGLAISTILLDILPKLRVPFKIFDLICKMIIIFPLYWLFTATMLTLTAISVWRYIAIKKPTKKMTAKNIKILCVLLWLASTITSIPVVLTAGSKHYECRQFFDNGSTTVKFVLCLLYLVNFAIPAVTMTTLYSLVLIKLNTKNLATNPNRNVKLKRKITLMLLTVTFTFIIFTLPWSITLLLSAATGKNSATLSLDQTYPLTQLIVQISRISFPLCIFYNPIVYFCFDQRIYNLFCSCFEHHTSSIQVNPKPTIQQN